MACVGCVVAHQVILIYHVIPDDLEWTRDRISVPVPDVTTMIRNAQQADVVYSVSYHVYDYFKALFHSLLLSAFASATVSDRINLGGNAITSVRLSVCFHSIFGTAHR